MHGVAGKASTLPHQATRLGQQTRNLSAHELVRDRLLAVRVKLGLVDHLPCTARSAVVVGLGLAAGAKLGLLGVEGVAVEVLGAANRSVAGDCVNHVDGVVCSVNHGVDAETEEMLMVVRVDLGVHLSAPRTSILTRVERVGVEDTSELDLRLDGSVLVEDPLASILVVGGSKDLLDDELASTGDGDGVISEVSVLEENTVVLLVNADGVLDGADRTIAGSKVGIEVVNDTLAVAAESQRVGKVTSTVFTEIKGVLALVRVLGVAIRHNHLRERKTVEDGTLNALVVEGDVVENDTLLVVEANVELPVLP